MERRLCREQAIYRIVDSGSVCVIYSSFDGNYEWTGTLAFNEPPHVKLLLPTNGPKFELMERSDSWDKQIVVNWLINSNENELATKIAEEITYESSW